MFPYGRPGSWLSLIIFFLIQELLISAFLLFQSDNLVLILRKLFSILSWLPSKVFLFLVGPETLENVQSIEDVNFYVNYLLWFQVIIKPCQWKCKQNCFSRAWGIDTAAHCNQPLLKIHLISCVFFYEMHYSCNKIHREKQLNCNFWEDSSSKRCHFHYLNQCSRSCLHERGMKWREGPVDGALSQLGTASEGKLKQPASDWSPFWVSMQSFETSLHLAGFFCPVLEELKKAVINQRLHSGKVSSLVKILLVSCFPHCCFPKCSLSSPWCSSAWAVIPGPTGKVPRVYIAILSYLPNPK